MHKCNSPKNALQSFSDNSNADMQQLAYNNNKYVMSTN